MFRWISKNFVAFVALLAFGATALMLSFQNSVVEQQRTLIGLLSHDSIELSALRVAEKRRQDSEKTKLAVVAGQTK